MNIFLTSLCRSLYMYKLLSTTFSFFLSFFLSFTYSNRLSLSHSYFNIVRCSFERMISFSITKSFSHADKHTHEHPRTHRHTHTHTHTHTRTFSLSLSFSHTKTFLFHHIFLNVAYNLSHYISPYFFFTLSHEEELAYVCIHLFSHNCFLLLIAKIYPSLLSLSLSLPLSLSL